MKTTCLYLFLSFITLWAKGQDNKTFRDLSPVDYLNYLEVTRGNISEKIYMAIAAGKLVCYKDSLLKKAHTPESFENIGSYDIEYLYWFRPTKYVSNGDTIHTYIEDTTGTSENYETVFYRAKREPHNPTKAFIFLNSTVMGFFLIDLSEHRKSLSKHSKFKSLSKDPTTVYFKYQEAINYLNSEEKSLLRYINTHLGNDSFSFDVSRQIAQKEFRRFASLLYSLGKDGKLPAYDNDSLASTLDSAAITYKAADKIFEFEYRDSTKKWDYKVNVTLIPFSPDSIRRIRVMDVWETTGPFEARCKLWAVAPTYSPVAAGLILQPSSWFWLVWDDAIPFLTLPEKDFYSYFLFDHQKNQANGDLGEYYYQKEKLFWEDGY